MKVHGFSNPLVLVVLVLLWTGCTREVAGTSSTLLTDGNEPGVTESVTDLIRKDFRQRSRTGTPPITEPSREQIERLKARRCPIDGTELLVVALPASRTYSDISNEAYYCPSHRVYWVRHTQGGFVGTVSVWHGPYGPLP